MSEKAENFDFFETTLTFPIAHCVPLPWWSFSTKWFVRFVCFLLGCFGKVIFHRNQFCWCRMFFTCEFKMNKGKPTFFWQGITFLALFWPNIPFVATKILVLEWSSTNGLRSIFSGDFSGSLPRFRPKSYWKKLLEFFFETLQSSDFSVLSVLKLMNATCFEEHFKKRVRQWVLIQSSSPSVFVSWTYCNKLWMKGSV